MIAKSHEGHRQRAIKKFEQGALLMHEVLEAMLFSLLPRKNTNDLAHRLLAEFGSLEGVYAASIPELKRVEGVGLKVAQGIYITGVFLYKYWGRDMSPFTGVFHSQDFLSYVKGQYSEIECEVIDLYLLDEGSHIRKQYRFTDEKIGFAEFSSVQLTNILSKEKPSGIVVVHNHPVGDAVPSTADGEMTRQCQIVCNIHGVLLCDHFIYAKNGVYSYYLSGELAKISREFTVKDLAQKEESLDEA